MTSRDFCYWLQGYIEITDGRKATLDAQQVECIRKHLAMVFKHEIDPSFGKDGPALDAIHSGSPWADPNEPVMRC